MEALAAMWGTIILLARLVLHIGVPIYLYNRAKQERLAQPWREQITESNL